MATINLELFTSKTLSDGRHPIMIRVTKDGKRSRFVIGSASVDEWDDVKKAIRPKSRKNHVADNIFIEDSFYKYKAKFNELTLSSVDWEPADVFAETVIKTDKEKSFQEYAASYLSTLDEKSGYYDTVKGRVNKIKRFHPKPFLISQIDNEWIKHFEKHCREKEKNNHGGIGNSKNTINETFGTIKTIVSFSGKRNESLEKRKKGSDEIIRLKLTEKEIEDIENFHLEGIQYHYRNAFLIQYYGRGMRIGDVLRLRKFNVRGGKIIYTTGKSNKAHAVKIVPKLQSVIEIYSEGDGFLFPFMKGSVDQSKDDLNNQVTYRTTEINKTLADMMDSLGIDKKITTHNARHSFAAIADKKLGGDLKFVQAMLGHSSRAMTEKYIKELRKSDEMDDLADSIFE